MTGQSNPQTGSASNPQNLRVIPGAGFSALLAEERGRCGTVASRRARRCVPPCLSGTSCTPSTDCVAPAKSSAERQYTHTHASRAHGLARPHICSPRLTPCPPPRAGDGSFANLSKAQTRDQGRPRQVLGGRQR
jgi:hypothetical protein